MLRKIIISVSLLFCTHKNFFFFFWIRLKTDLLSFEAWPHIILYIRVRYSSGPNASFRLCLPGRLQRLYPAQSEWSLLMYTQQEKRCVGILRRLCECTMLSAGISITQLRSLFIYFWILWKCMLHSFTSVQQVVYKYCIDTTYSSHHASQRQAK